MQETDKGKIIIQSQVSQSILSEKNTPDELSLYVGLVNFSVVA